jgi:prepilin-type N-terminal cleavage/methylation domain-containing protein
VSPRPALAGRVRDSRRGFTAIELVMALTVIALVLVNVSSIVRSSTNVYESGTMSSMLDEQAEQVMDRIAYSVMSARIEDVDAPSAPLHVSSLEFPLPLGVENGQQIWSDPERIELVIETGQIVNTRTSALGNEQRIVWSNHATEMLEGELANEEDDNGNGLMDERGLAFDVDRGQVAIRLTLRRVDTKQVVYTRTLETRVTCRN